MADNRTTIQDILEATYKDGKINIDTFNYRQRKTLYDILTCHTEACGFSVSYCTECGHQEIHYGSCHNNSCPMCGAYEREEWAANLNRYIVDVPYYHLIFTVPDCLNPVFLADPKSMYNLFFNKVKSTLESFAQDEKFMGVKKCGFISTLHTWGQTMIYHPHIHVIFCAGGLDGDGNWVQNKKDNYLFPAKALAKKLKGAFLFSLKHHPSDAIKKNLPDLEGYIDQANYKKWNVEIRSSVTGPEHVINYLAKYVNRTAISNSRIVSYKDGKVSFSYKDNKDHGKKKIMILDDKEFVRRFFMHVPPSHFSKIRHYGFMSYSSRGKMIPKIREKLNQDKNLPAMPSKESILKKIVKRDVTRCPVCNGIMESDINPNFERGKFWEDKLRALGKRKVQNVLGSPG